MEDSGAYMKKQLGKPDPRSPPRIEPDVSYVELHFKTLSVPRVRTNGDSLTSTYSDLKFGKVEPLIGEVEEPGIASSSGKLRVSAQTDRLTPTYSELNFRRNKTLIDEDEDPPIASGHGGLATTAQTDAREPQSKVKIGNRPNRLICLFSLFTSALIVIVAGLSIHGMHSNLRHQFTEMETKYISVNETKAHICELLTRREPTCFKNWIRNKDRCYFISTVHLAYDRAMQRCSSLDSRLFEINSADEANFVYNLLHHGYRTYWIGKCEDGNVESNLMYMANDGEPNCTRCKSYGWTCNCKDEHYFICEKSAPLFPDVLEKMLVLCQEPLGLTSIK